MTGTEFIQALAELGWKQTDFCGRTGLHRNTTSRWVTGEVPVPEWVDAFLGAMLAIKRLHDTFISVD
jgi:transcriptional regulator with XRE-family HTH domain